MASLQVQFKFDHSSERSLNSTGDGSFQILFNLLCPRQPQAEVRGLRGQEGVSLQQLVEPSPHQDLCQQTGLQLVLTRLAPRYLPSSWHSREPRQ